MRMLAPVALLAAAVGCGGGFGTGTTPVSGTCASAADCSGALPAICQVCSSGETACAHFACVGGQCEVQVCP